MSYLRKGRKGQQGNKQQFPGKSMHQTEQSAPPQNHHRDKPETSKKQNKPNVPARLGKHILAAYYNDARLNILACLNDIREKSGKKRLENEDQIRTAFSDLKLVDETPEQQDELIKHLRYRFHFLDLLTDAKGDLSGKNKQDNAVPLPRYYESHLTWMLELVNGLRNTMAHPVDDEMMIPYAMHRQLFFALSQIYDSSFHTVKNRFGHTTEVMNPFKRCDRKGKPQTPPQFSFALCADIEKLSKDSLLPQSKVLFDFGHILFCSLFLEKSQSSELISYFWQTKQGKKWENTDQRTIIREMIAVYRVRLPIQRLKSDDTTTSVTMDTLSELSRCPRALLERLSPEDQNRFRGEPGTGVNEAGEEVVIDAENTWLFARSRKDRFIPLMMRLLDFNLANPLRFAVDLGQFYYNVRLKPASEFTDGQPRVRRLSQKLLAYGKLQDFEQAEKPADWQQLEENAKVARDEREKLTDSAGDSIRQLKPHIVPTYPHYHYFDDKIGFRIDDTTAVYPELQAGSADQPVALDSPQGRDMMPEFWMSPAQMLQVVFYIHLQQNNSRHLRFYDVLIRYRSGMTRLILALQRGEANLSGEPHSRERAQAVQQWLDQLFGVRNENSYRVTLNTLPKVVIKHLLGGGQTTVSVAEMIKRAKHLLDRTVVRQQRLKSQLRMADKKRGQKGFRAIKCGPLGDFIAEDLMRFQPVDGNRSDGGKINSQQYQILQKTLAYYGAHIEEPPRIVDLLRDANLLSGPFAHPFIHELGLEQRPEKYKGLISFYEAYLAARVSYLKRFIKEHESRSSVSFVPHWLRLRQPSTLDNWLSEQLDDTGKLAQPLPLTNNMLYRPILRMVAEALDLSPEVIEQEGTQLLQRDGKIVEIQPSVTWLIKRYVNGRGDAVQRMYSDYPRRHDLLDTWLDNRTKKQRFSEKPQHYLLETERQREMEYIQQFVERHYPDDGDEVERIRQLMANKPQAKEATGDVAKAIKLKSLLRAYQRDEQQVRFSISQDMLLYLSAQQYLENLQLAHPEAAPDWSLRELEKDLLKTEIDYRLAVPDSDKELLHPSCKIRDRGELSLLVRDRRLKSLLRYYPEHETLIHHTEVRYELNSYRRAKVAIMALTHQLEKHILAVLGDVPVRDKALKKQTTDFGGARHGDFLYALSCHFAEHADSALTDAFQLQYFIRTLWIRNAFSHNEYPDTALFPELVAAIRAEPVPDEPANNRQIAKRLQSELERIYQPWLDYLQAQTRLAGSTGLSA